MDVIQNTHIHDFSMQMLPNIRKKCLTAFCVYSCISDPQIIDKRKVDITEFQIVEMVFQCKTEIRPTPPPLLIVRAPCCVQNVITWPCGTITNVRKYNMLEIYYCYEISLKTVPDILLINKSNTNRAGAMHCILSLFSGPQVCTAVGVMRMIMSSGGVVVVVFTSIFTNSSPKMAQKYK